MDNKRILTLIKLNTKVGLRLKRVMDITNQHAR